ncbi:MAG: Wzz/FepE/Etk N-terminal domain-containing protein, partial [Cyclonatronaceae bacterium]
MSSSFQYDGENHYEGAVNGSDDEIDLKQIFSTVYRYKWLLLVCILISGVAAWIYANSLTPIYQSEGTIIIKETQRGMGMRGSDLENLVASAYGVGMGSTIANELQVMQS